METYKILRFYRDGRKTRTMARGMTLKAAQVHCRSEKTHKKDDKGEVIWFDGYTEEK